MFCSPPPVNYGPILLTGNRARPFDCSTGVWCEGKHSLSWVASFGGGAGEVRAVVDVTAADMTTCAFKDGSSEICADSCHNLGER